MTKTLAVRFLRILVVVAALTSLVGCEGDSSGESGSNNVDMTGTWISEAGSVFNIQQSGITLTGTSSHPGQRSHPLTGTVIDSHMMLTEDFGSYVVLRWEGDVSGNIVENVTTLDNHRTVTAMVNWYRQ